MKKIGKAFCVWGIAIILTACGREASPAANLAQDINLGAGKTENGGTGGSGGSNEAEPQVQADSKEAGGAFRFVYQGAVLVPGEMVDHSALPECSDVAEVPSCAFDGNDKVYNFKAFELTTYTEKDEEYVYAIYFIDPNLSTTEGLGLGDSVNDMKSLYGENYKAEGTACTYKRGETLLNIILRDDIVASIEYRLDR